MKALIGVISEKRLRDRMLAIATGKYKPSPNEPKFWFSSLIAVGQLLSNDNIELLRLMHREKPQSVTQLAEMTGRQVSNLSATLKSLAGRGFVVLNKKGNTVIPVAQFTDFEIQVDHEVLEVSHNKAA